MGEPTIFRKIRSWLAFEIALPIFYALFGSRPLFCDFAETCDLQNGLTSLFGQLKDERIAYNRAMWALIAAAGGEIRIPPVILHDANLPSSTISTYEDTKTGEYVYSVL